MGLFRTADLAALAEAPFTYAEVGGTRSGRLPEGTAPGAVGGRGHRTGGLRAGGRGAVRLAGAARRRSAGSPRPGRPSQPGTVVVLTAGLPWLGYDIPCRVVWAQTTGLERGFGYGTLPGHPESGEESFAAPHAPERNGRVHHPGLLPAGLPLARLGGPVSRAAQRTALELYARAITAAAAG